MLLLQQGKKKRSASILRDEFFVERAFFYLFPKSDYDAFRDITVSPARCINQGLVNFNQYFASDANLFICV